MKFTNLKMTFIAALSVLVLAACGGKKTEQTETTTETETAAEVEAVTYAVSNDASEVAWKGEVAGVYGHNGVIDIKSGSITAEGDKITGGEIVIDMTTIQPLDSASYKDEDGSRASDLVGHLSTGDFFLVEEFPTATFTVKSHEGNKLTGDLTIRGNTNEEVVELSSVTATGDSFEGAGTLVFDRQDYDVNWVHFMKDMVLSDDITLNLTISASK